MNKALLEKINHIDTNKARQSKEVLTDCIKAAQASGYKIAEIIDDKPWGGMVRFEYSNADTFIEEFFPGLSPVEARLGDPDAKLSPKLLVVDPEKRLSWQYHDRRAERWSYITEGKFMRSQDDTQPDVSLADAGDVVQFLAGERHRLIGGHSITIVAEIWQHTDPKSPSDEADIIRVSDDYSR